MKQSDINLHSFLFRLHGFQKESLRENNTSLHFIYYLTKQFSNELMVSDASLKASSVQHDVHLVNYSPI